MHVFSLQKFLSESMSPKYQISTKQIDQLQKNSSSSPCITTHAHTHERTHARTHTHTHPFNCPFSGITQVSQYQKGKTNLDFTEARDSEWHQLGHMQVCTSLQTDNHASTPPLSFLQAGCPSCCPTNSVKALKAYCHYYDNSLAQLIIRQNNFQRYKACKQNYCTQQQQVTSAQMKRQSDVHNVRWMCCSTRICWCRSASLCA